MNTLDFYFEFRFAGYGVYVVTYSTPTRGDYWRARITDMSLIDETKNADTLDIAPAAPAKNLYIIGHAKN